MANRIKGITVAIGGDTIGLQKSLKDVNKVTASLQSELNQVNYQLKFDPSSTVLLSQKQDVLKEAIEASKEKLKQLEDVQEDIERQYKNGKIDNGQYRAYQREVEQTKDKIKSYEEQLKHAGATQAEFDKKVANAKETLTKNKQAFATGAKTAAKWGLAVGTAMAGAGTAAIKYSADFETAFAKVETLLSESINKSKYKQDILDLSNELAVDANEVAESVYQALSASVDEKSAIKFVKDAYSLSKGGFTDLATAVDVETTAINAYKMSAKDAAKVNDILITTQNKGKTTVDQLASKIGKVIPVAAAYNVSLEQLGAQYAILTAKGVNTANATTQLRSMLNELNTSGKKVALTLNQETGKTFSQLSGEGKNVYDVLEILFNSVGRNKDAFADLFKNANAKSAALSLLDSGAKKFNETLGLMTNSTGAAEKAYEKMSNTAEHKLAKIQTNLKNSAITIGNALLPTVSELLEEVEEELPNIQNIAKDLGEFIGDGAKWAIEHGDIILKVLKAIGIETVGIYTAIKLNSAAKYIFETVNALRTLKTTTDAVKVATEGATVAQTAFNVAEKANVIGAVASAVVILGTTLWSLYELTKDNTEATDEFNRSTEKLMETMAEEVKAWDEIKTARKKSFSNVNSEFGYYSDLSRELNKITKKNGEIKKGYEERAQVIATTLNNALGTEITLNGNVVESYKNVQKEIKRTIAVKKAEAQLSAAQESYDTAINNKQEAFGTLSDSKIELKELEKKRKSAEEYKKKLEKERKTGGFLYDDAEAKVDYFDEEIRKLKGKIKEYEENYLSYVNTIDNYNNLLSAIENGSVDDIEKALTRLTNSFITAENGTKKSLKAQVDSARKNYKDLKSALDEGAPGVTKSAVRNAKDLKNQAVAELKKFKKEAKDNADETGENAGNISNPKNKQNARRNAKEIKEHHVAGLKVTEDDKNTIENSYKSLINRTGSKANQDLAKSKSKSLARNFVDGFLNFLNSDNILSKAFNAGWNFVSQALSGIQKGQDSNSPSKKSAKLAQDNADGFILRLLDNKDKSYTAGVEMAKSALKGIKEAQINSVEKAKYNSNDINSRLASLSSSGINLRNDSKVINNSPTVHVSFGNVTVRNNQDINAIADAVTDRVSENLANIVIREDNSYGG